MKTYFARSFWVATETHLNAGEYAIGSTVFLGEYPVRSVTPQFKERLYLCSRDVHPGDTVFVKNWNSPLKEFTLNQDVYSASIMTSGEHSFAKKIGEISQEAKWVRNGDEFEEEQLSKEIIYLYGEGSSGHRRGMKIIDPDPIGEAVFMDGTGVIYQIERRIIHILGPCGHFH